MGLTIGVEDALTSICPATGEGRRTTETLVAAEVEAAGRDPLRGDLWSGSILPISESMQAG